MKTKYLVVALATATLIGAGAAYAGLGTSRTPVEFYSGHTHGPDMEAIGAPEHSGGTDRNGCHNASVPYHCH